MANATVRFIIKRQANPESTPYWEEFDLRLRPGLNVIIGLMDIAANPTDRFGKIRTPVTYDSNCLEKEGSFSGGPSFIAVVQPADLRYCHDSPHYRRFNQSWLGRILA